MLSPSRGFLFCLPVRLGALVVSLLAFLGSGILSGFTFHSLATVSAHITPVQTAGFYLASVSWISLSLFSLLGFISVVLQHPLLLTIFARFVVFHLPANLICNIFFTVVLFHSYRDAEVVLRSPQCGRGSQGPLVCRVSTSLQTLTWLYLFVLLPAAIAQTYIYFVVKRFIFVISGEWALEREQALETQRRSVAKSPGKSSDRKRRTTITQTIGNGGRRRAKAQLWFTMETPSLEADESFLPSMILSPMAFPQSPPRSPFNSTKSGLPASPLSSFKFPRTNNKSSKSSLHPPADAGLIKEKDGASDRSARLDMDFSDPDPGPVAGSPRSGEWLKPGGSLKPKAVEQELRSKERDRISDSSIYSVDSLRVSLSEERLQ